MKRTPRLNYDRFGLPADYATYEWTLYRRVVPDDSPARLRFLFSTVATFPEAMGMVLRRRLLDFYATAHDVT